MNSLSTHSLTVSIGDTLVCQDLNWHIEPEQVWGILGINGSGKTTLLHTLAGLRAPQSGQVLIDDFELSHLTRRDIAQKLGVLFQDHNSLFPASVLEIALNGRHPHLHAWQSETNDDKQIAINALKKVGLDGMQERNILTLSGGEQQRLAMATLLVQTPSLYLLDEPHNHLDPHQQIKLLDMFTATTGNAKASLCMTLHDMNLAARYCTHTLLLLGNGETRLGPHDECMTEANLSQLYAHPIKRINGPKHPIWLPE